jgi:ribonucleoside-diphosphate reductase alpha chain/ribonucleoside-triphosphate reductase
MAFVEDGKLNTEEVLEAQKLNARIAYRVTIPTLELPRWDNNQRRDRLLGLSMTGYQDMVNATNMSEQEQRELLRDMRRVARESADSYANELGLNTSELITTVKPEGSLSCLPTVSAGVHFSHSPYYVRRVRINAEDPLLKVCEELGYPIYPEVGQDMETCTTKVVEFPVKAPEGRTKYEVSAIEQLEIYKMFMEEYVDHNASNTISVQNHEWEDVVDWIYNNWETVIGVTFLSLTDSFYQLMPYESITEEEYNQRVSAMKPFNPNLLSKYEKVEQDLDLGDSECTGGACPIR